MADYRPGDIYTGSFGVSGADDVLTASPAGSSEQWADDSDATYCDIYAQNAGAETGVSTTLASADFPTISGSIASLLIRCRIELLVSEDVDQQKYGILFPTAEGNSSSDRQNIAPGNVTAGLTTGVPDWVEFDLTSDSIMGRLTDGVTIMFGTRFAPLGTTTPVAMFRVYEVVLVATTAGSGHAPMRRYPREDGYGIGPTRHWPPPKSRRAAGGYH